MSHSSNDLTVTKARLRQEFEAKWEQGDRPDIENYLDQVSPVDRTPLFVQLLRVQSAQCERMGEAINWQELRRRFPDRVEQIEQVRHATDRTTGLNEDDSADLTAPSSEVTSVLQPETLGETLGDYELIEKVGRGGMGVVYKARHVELDRVFAVKVLPLIQSIETSARTRFQIEAKAAAQLDHPNIVSVYAIGIDRGTYYYAMQYVEGGNLSQLIDEIRTGSADSSGAISASKFKGSTLNGSGKRKSTRDSHHESGLIRDIESRGPTVTTAFLNAFATIAAQVADALHYAHTMGVVHRDIKPSNLLVDPRGRIFVSDFGLARVQGESELTAPGNIVGTLRYMSPEQAYAQRVVVDHRTDVFSLGASLYELLLLRYAFNGTSKAEILRQIAFHDPIPPRRIDPRVPQDLETIVLKCLAKNPDERYQTADEVAADFRAWLDDEPIAARPPNLIQRSAKWARKHRALVQSTAAILLVIALSIYSALAFAVQAERTAREETEATNEVLSEALQVSEGRRLIALASLELSDSPGLAAALATEGLKKHDTAVGRNALQAALDATHEEMVLPQSTEMGTISVRTDGQWMAVASAWMSSRSQDALPVRIYDTQTGEWVKDLIDRASITSAVFSPNGKRLLTTTTRGDDFPHDPEQQSEFPVSLWEVSSGSKLGELAGARLAKAHRHSFRSDGGQTLVVAPAVNHLVRVYNAVGEVRRSFAGHTDRVTFAAFGPLGNKIVSISDDHTVRIWDFQSGDELVTLRSWENRSTVPQPRLVRYAEFSKDESQVLTASPQVGIELWDLETEQSRTCGRGEFATFSPDGEQIAIINHGMVRLIDAQTLQVKHEFTDPERGFRHVEFSPDSRRVVTSTTANFARVWDSVSGQLIAELHGHEGPVNQVSFIPHHSRLVSTSDDATVRIWSLASGAEQDRFPTELAQSQPIFSVAPSGDRAIMTAKSVVTGAVWDETIENVLREFPANTTSMDRGGQYACTLTRDVVQVWEIESGQPVAEFQRRMDQFRNAHLSPDGEAVVVTSTRGPTWLWRWRDGDTFVLLEGSSTTSAFDFHPTLPRLATIGEDETLRVFDTKNGELVGDFSVPGVGRFVKYSGEGTRLIAITRSQHGIVLNSNALEEICRLEAGEIRFHQAVFSASGKYLVTLHVNGGPFAVWDAATGELVHRSNGPQGSPSMVAHPSRDAVLLIGDDSEMRLWDLETGETLQTFPGRYSDAAFADDADTLVAVTDQPLLKLPTRATDSGDDVEPVLSPQLVRLRVDDGAQLQAVPMLNASADRLAISTESGRVLVRRRHYPLELVTVATRQTDRRTLAHGAPITFAQFTPDESHVVTCSWDGSAVIWDADSLERLMTLPNQSGPMVAGSLSHDGQLLAAASNDGTITVWDMKTGERRRELAGLNSPALGLSFGAFGKRLVAYAQDRTWKVWDVDSGATIKLRETGRPMDYVAYQPNGAAMVLFPRPERYLRAEERAEQVGEPESGFPLLLRMRSGAVVRLEHDRAPRVIRFSPSGNRLLTVSGRPSGSGDQVTLWDVATGQRQAVIRKPGHPLRMAAMNDAESVLITVHDSSVTAWNLQGEEQLTIQEELGFTAAREIDYAIADGSILFAKSNDNHIRAFSLDPLNGPRQARPLTAIERSRYHVILADPAED